MACPSASRCNGPRNISPSSSRSWRGRSRWSSMATSTAIPYAGPGATGLGRPLRSIAHGDPNVCSIPPRSRRPGCARRRGGRWQLADFLLAGCTGRRDRPTLEGRRRSARRWTVSTPLRSCAPRWGRMSAACRDAIRPELALYIGGMGARTKNFYNDMVSAMGFEAEAKASRICTWTERRTTPPAKVPDKLIDAISSGRSSGADPDRLQSLEGVAGRPRRHNGAEGRERRCHACRCGGGA